MTDNIHPSTVKGEPDMTYDLARKIGEAEAWDRLAAAIESGNKEAARAAVNFLRKVEAVR